LGIVFRGIVNPCIKCLVAIFLFFTGIEC